MTNTPNILDLNKLNELYAPVKSLGDGLAARPFYNELVRVWPSLYKELMAGRKLVESCREVFRKAEGGADITPETMHLLSLIFEYDNALKD